MEGNGRKAGTRSAADPKGLVQGGIGWQRWQWEGNAGGGNKKAEFHTRLGSQVGKAAVRGVQGRWGWERGGSILTAGLLEGACALHPCWMSLLWRPCCEAAMERILLGRQCVAVGMRVRARVAADRR